jgi:ABC-2 type transport system permease protein
MSRLGAFIRRDIIHASSYKAAFAYQIATLGSSVLTVYFLSGMVGGTQIASLSPYGGDYFSFAIIGVALADYLAVSLHGFSQAIRMSQMLGTLEAMLATPTPPTVIVFGSALYKFLWSLLRVLLYILCGLALGAQFPGVNLPALVCTLILSVLAFGSVGLLGASLVLVLKAWNPLTALFSGLSMLLGGVLYPVQSMPAAAQVGAMVLPITYALEAMRGALLTGKSISDLAVPLLILAGFTVVVMPVALFAFQGALRHLRRQGSISHY